MPRYRFHSAYEHFRVGDEFNSNLEWGDCVICNSNYNSLIPLSVLDRISDISIGEIPVEHYLRVALCPCGGALTTPKTASKAGSLVNELSKIFLCDKCGDEHLLKQEYWPSMKYRVKK
jgi:hypothetical protein